MSGVLLAQLRERTRPAHDMVEGRLPLTSPHDEATLARALAVLQGLATVVNERDPSTGDLPWGERQPRAAWYAQDRCRLAQRGAVADDVTVDVDVPAQWPAVAGAYYVLEGSALGAKLITRALEQNHRWLGDEPHAFRRVADAGSGRWRAFVTWLPTQPAESHSAIVDAAEATFTALAEALDRAGF